MKLKEFLCESDEELRKSILESDDMKELSEMVEHLRQPNTKKFLADNDLIYRGMKDMPRVLSGVYTVWSNRTPKDSGEKWHNLYNKALKSFDDNKEWRSNSLFVTRKRNYIPRHLSEIMLKCDTYIAMRMKSLDRFNDIRESNGKRTFIPESDLPQYFMKIVKQNPNSTQQIIDIIMK